MSSQEYTSKISKKKSSSKWLPVLGLLLIVALAAIAYVVSEPVHETLYSVMFEQQEARQGIARGSSNSFMQPPMKYGVAVIVFIVLVLFMSMLYTLFAPKPKYNVHEKDMKKERDQKEHERRQEKLRKQKINKQMAVERERQMLEDEKAKKNKRR